MARPAVTQSQGTASEPSIGDLVSTAIKDASTLVKYQIDLAKVELRDDAQRVGLSAALGGTIMFFGFLILVMLSFAYAYGLITAGIWNWAAFLIVAGTWAVLAAICAVVIRARLKGMTGLRRTRESVQEDLAMLKRDEETPEQPAVEGTPERPAVEAG